MNTQLLSIYEKIAHRKVHLNPPQVGMGVVCYITLNLVIITQILILVLSL